MFLQWVHVCIFLRDRLIRCLLGIHLRQGGDMVPAFRGVWSTAQGCGSPVTWSGERR